MEGLVRGDVVAVDFPFSTELSFKRRPAIVLAVIPFSRSHDYLLCLVTSQKVPDPNMVELAVADVMEGTLDKLSYARPGYLWTSDGGLIARRVGKLREAKLDEVLSKVRAIFS